MMQQNSSDNQDAKSAKKFWWFKKKANMQNATDVTNKTDENTATAVKITDDVPKLAIKNTTQSATKKNKQSSTVPIVRRNLMTEREQQMYDFLVKTLPYSAIFPQVSFNSLITITDEITNPFKIQDNRSEFNRKVVDFVIYNPKKHQVIAIIELDDITHTSTKAQKNDQKRDGQLNQAGYVVLRYNEIPKASELLKKIKAIRELYG